MFSYEKDNVFIFIRIVLLYNFESTDDRGV